MESLGKTLTFRRKLFAGAFHALTIHHCLDFRISACNGTACAGSGLRSGRAAFAQVEVRVYDKDFWQTLAPGLVRSDFEWLQLIRASVSSIIVFGCWDDGDTDRGCREAYVLLRMLDASRAMVVDKEARYIRNARGWYQETQARFPELFGAYDLMFDVSDMTRETDELPIDCFDLAYCSGVLYFMRPDVGQLQAAVDTMARVVKPGGWVIACEGEGLDNRFEEAGLERVESSTNVPDYAYYYRKPLSTRT